jgi:hypothetical protein
MRTISPASFQAYKALYPNDKKLQALTLEELYQQTGQGTVSWGSINYEGMDDNHTEPAILKDISPCALGIGYVVFDCVCLFLGAIALRSSVTAKAAAQMSEAAEPAINQISKYIKTISAAESSKMDIASAVFGVISTIYSAGCLGAVIGAFLGTLEWYQAVLYGATALGTIMAAVATDGAAEIGIIVVELATAGFLVDDSIKCAEACSY